MGKIAVHEFVSLDGVFEQPTWTFEFGFDPEMGEAIGRMTATSDGILLGRTTFEQFAPAWSTRTAEDDPGAPFFNDTPKHVVSATLESADGWQKSSVLGGYDAEAIGRLKADSQGLYISGSGQLVRGLLADGLVDELHLFVYPVVLGSGAKLFPDGGDRQKLSLIASESYDNGVLHVTYGAPAAS